MSANASQRLANGPHAASEVEMRSGNYGHVVRPSERRNGGTK